MVKKVLLVGATMGLLWLDCLTAWAQNNDPCTAYEISAYTHGHADSFSIRCDTLEYIKMLLKVYKDRYENCTYFVKKDTVKVSEEADNPQSMTVTASHSHRSSFVILYIIEFEIIRKKRRPALDYPYIRNSLKDYDIKAEFYEDLDAVNIFTNEAFRDEVKYDSKHLKWIYKHYLKWVRKANKIGFAEAVASGRTPLSDSNYEWVVSFSSK